MKKILKIIAKVLGGIIGGVFCLLFIAWISFFISKYFIFSDYYSIRSKVARNPGMNNGYVPQGCTYNDDEDYYITAGYMKDESASRIYKVDKKNRKITYYSLSSNGQDFLGHTGGIQYAKGYFYIANESDGLYKFSASLLKDNKTVEIGSPIQVNNHSSFVFSDDTYLYVGEFNNDKGYPCYNEIQYNGKTQRAIVTKYALDNFEKALEIYSIPNEIQGFAVTPSEKIVLSRSWALYKSDYFIFEPEDLIDTKQTYDGAKVYFLDRENCSKSFKALPMSEDLDYADGKVLCMSECACNKYILGKFYFDFFIYGLKID